MATAAAEGVGDVALSQFAVTLRQCNLEDKQAQYLVSSCPLLLLPFLVADCHVLAK